MRTLIIDNYDSFTWNLHQLVSVTNGQRATVIRNDDPSFSLSLLSEFDNVIISPGPGTPEVPEDIGIARKVIEHALSPVLGVCL